MLVAPGVGLGALDGLAVGVAEGLTVGVGVGSAVPPGVAPGLAEGVGVGVGLGLGPSVLAGVDVGPALGVAEGVTTGVGLALGDSPGVLLSVPEEQPASHNAVTASIRLRGTQPRFKVFATVYRAFCVSQCIAHPCHQRTAIITAPAF